MCVEKEKLHEIITEIVFLYDNKLEYILANYTSVFHKICVGLYSSEHSFPKLPKKVKLDKNWTLAKIYMKYIEYIDRLFKLIVGIVQYLSGNNERFFVFISFNFVFKSI